MAAATAKFEHPLGKTRFRRITLFGNKKMFPRIKGLFGKEEALPECFTGVGVVLISDQCSARPLGAPLGPADLVGMMNEVLTFQTDTIQRFEGVVDKYVGGCVVAYWPPRAMPRAVSSAASAASALVKKKGVSRISFDIRVSFSAAEFAVAAFGPTGRQRVQVIGRAYERADTMQLRLRGGGVITDAETFEMLPEVTKIGFVLRDGYAYCTE